MVSLAMRGAIGVRSQSPIESGDIFSVPFPQLHTPAARWVFRPLETASGFRRQDDGQRTTLKRQRLAVNTRLLMLAEGSWLVSSSSLSAGAPA